MAEVKEHKSDPLKDVSSATEDANLLNTMEGRMGNLDNILKGKDPADPEPEPEPSTPEPKPAEDPEPEHGSTPEPEPKGDGSKDTEDPPVSDKPELPEAYIRCAIHQGWSAEDVQEDFEANPERALRTFKNIYETTNKATRDFAAIGRERAETAQKAAEDRARVEAPEVTDFITADEITKIADGDEATAKVLKVLNTRLKNQATELAGQRKPGPSANDLEFARSNQVAETARARATADNNTLTMVNRFFAADSMKSYNGFYGAIEPGQDMNDITPRQRSNRIEVLQIADQLTVGKESQGMRISTDEALESAHLLVTESLREKIVTDKIKASLTKRSKSKTLRPSNSRKIATNDGSKKAKNRDEAVANAEARLAKFRKDW